MKSWRSASSQEWQKVLVEEEDREELGVMTSRNGHTHPSTEEALQMTKDHAAWRGVVHHAANVRDSE